MIVEIVTTGTELLLGQIVNTNAAFLAQELNKLGFDVLYHTTVGDNRVRMKEVLTMAANRADIVVTSGGLGPTQGDITKEVTAVLCDCRLIFHESIMRSINNYLRGLHKNVVASNKRQAYIPEGAVILPNECGTAPGVIAKTAAGKLIINLPGPPPELKDMYFKQVMPYLKRNFGATGVITSRVLNTCGIGESALEDAIKDLIAKQSNPTLALLARREGVLIRITAKAADEQAANAAIAELEDEIRKRLDKYIYSIDNVTMEEIVIGQLLRHNLTISCAESCTGGLMSSRLTDVAGSSNCLAGSIVSYTNEVKMAELGIDEAILREYTAVSAETASAMADSVRKKFGTSIGVGITGVAGPGALSPSQPQGLVYIALSDGVSVTVRQYHFGGKRTAVKYSAAQMALNLVRNHLNEL